MQTIKNSLTLNYPLDLVIQVSHFDLLHNLPGYTQMLGMEEIKLLRFDEQEDGRHEVEFIFKSKDRLPALAKRIIKPEMLAWRQVGSWDPETLSMKFKIIPRFFANLVKVRGVKSYSQNGGGATMHFDVRIGIGIPGIGDLMEKTIAREIKKEQAKMFVKIEQEVARRAREAAVGES